MTASTTPSASSRWRMRRRQRADIKETAQNAGYRRGRRPHPRAVRAITHPESRRAESAIVVPNAVQNEGLGRALMSRMIAYARARGPEILVGQAMADNERMLKPMRSLGFTLEFAGHNTYDARLRLAA